MRALFVIPQRELTSGARALVDGAWALATRGEEVTVGTVPGGDVDTAARRLALETVPLAEGERAIRASARLRQTIESRFVDTVVVGSERDLVLAAWAIRRAGRGTIVRRIPAGERLERRTRSRWAERLAPVAYLHASGAAAEAGTARLEVVESPLGVRVPERAADLGNGEGTHHLVAVADSRGPTASDVSQVLRTFALLRERFARLRLAVLGPAARDVDVKLHAAALRVSDHVDWIDDPGSREATLARATVGCIAADHDGLVLGCLDFMAHGVPFVCRRVPLIERYVAHDIHGVLVPTFDPARTASELAVLLASRERREAMGAAARARVERDFSDRTVAAALEQAARRLSDRKRR